MNVIVSKYNDLELALMVLLGWCGNGQARRDKLGSRYNDVQGIVEELLQGRIPEGGGNVDPDKLEKAVNKTFEEVLMEISEEIKQEYGKV